MGIYIVQRSVSFLGFWYGQIIGLFMRKARLHGWRVPAIATAFCALSYVAHGASVTVTGPADLRADVIAVATTTYNATITASSFFPGSYTVNLLSKKPAVACEQAPVCDLDKDLALVVAASSWSYVNGFANGQDYQRNGDLVIGGTVYSACTSTDTCTSCAARISNAIYQQGVDTPTVISVP